MNKTSPSHAALWSGRILSGLVVLFMAMDGAMKLVKPAPVVEASAKIGLSESAITPIGLVLLVATALYAFRATSVLGAILLTGFLGGAVATNLLAHTPTFNLVFPIAFGVLAWGGLVLRNEKLRELLVPGLQSEAASHLEILDAAQG